jgi:glycosyltransferase involved in cell wall biosynthesis
VIPGATVVDRRIPVKALNFMWHRLGWPDAGALVRERLDIAHSAHPLLMPVRNAAGVITVHDLDFLDHPERTRDEIRRDYPALAAPHARRADRVVAVSKHTASEVERRLGVAADRISICSPGRPAWPKREAEPEPGYILFFGTLEPRKNVGALVEAYAHLVTRRPECPRLMLAGGLTPAAEAIERRVHEAPLAGRVDLPGYIDPRDRDALYRGALVLVMPSHTEGFGIPALEAMTIGVPVIAANRGALPEVVGAAGKLIDPDDPMALAAALESVVFDRPTRDGMREAGWRESLRYDWSITARQTREAWALAMDARRRRRG